MASPALINLVDNAMANNLELVKKMVLSHPKFTLFPVFALNSLNCEYLSELSRSIADQIDADFRDKPLGEFLEYAQDVFGRLQAHLDDCEDSILVKVITHRQKFIHYSTFTESNMSKYEKIIDTVARNQRGKHIDSVIDGSQSSSSSSNTGTVSGLNLRPDNGAASSNDQTQQPSKSSIPISTVAATISLRPISRCHSEEIFEKFKEFSVKTKTLMNNRFVVFNGICYNYSYDNTDGNGSSSSSGGGGINVGEVSMNGDEFANIFCGILFNCQITAGLVSICLLALNMFINEEYDEEIGGGCKKLLELAMSRPSILYLWS
ncbi:hypothetical protein H4219_005855 [Mycoemilia scoparia]|uniref:Uncharacterized protein n=1 Tax=Mycoemilia scoparia TaxID=417184 RepID=A0A9W8DNK5_9FUNG|nr:hypothetical protein H4219_005855 [Mycoemilia scoparia]